jgi:large subunit ribosomal protein L13
MIIDATNLILGRLAAKAAKLALLGEQVIIINCENAVISGKKEIILQKFKTKEHRTQPFKGPFAKRMPDRIVRAAIRGMLPHGRWSEGSRGRLALNRIKCFIGVPEEFKGQKFETFPEISVNNLKTQFYVKIGDISALLRQAHK